MRGEANARLSSRERRMKGRAHTGESGGRDGLGWKRMSSPFGTLLKLRALRLVVSLPSLRRTLARAEEDEPGYDK